jgi:hypothetical protein
MFVEHPIITDQMGASHSDAEQQEQKQQQQKS